MDDIKHIPMEKCRNGWTYRIMSRNLTSGVYVAEKKGFVGVRQKFDRRYLFVEFHWETGAPFGTVHPKEEVEECPLKDLRENFDTVCDKCGKGVEYREELYKTDKWPWVHLEKSRCRKVDPVSHMNKPLFDYLEAFEKRMDERDDVEMAGKSCKKCGATTGLDRYDGFCKHSGICWENQKKRGSTK